MPLSWVYAGLVWLRRFAYRKQWLPSTSLPIPVVVVGNIFVGGTGKTPVVIALIHDLLALGKKPGLVSRGYGANIPQSSPARVAKTTLTKKTLNSEQFGDEPALVAFTTGIPIAVHPKRAQAAEALIKAYPEVDILICDDGLQHLALGRNVEIVVQDERGHGNGLTFPAGPLREPKGRLKHVDAILTRSLIFNTPSTFHAHKSEPPYLTQFAVNISHFQNLNQPTQTFSPNDFIERVALHAKRKICAMAAIGFPDRFFLELQNLGLKLDQSIAMPDHDVINAADFHCICADDIIITAKDAIKLKHVDDHRIWIAHTKLTWLDPNFTKWVLTQSS
jgi:tetraacyldisaccharide 4'-kinase